MAQRRRTVTLTPKDLERLGRTQEIGEAIIERHLVGPMKAITARSYNRPEVASALLTLAYDALRQNRSQDKTNELFSVLSHIAALRIEDRLKKKRKRLH